MLIGLNDFDSYRFLTFNDTDIFLYYSDFETIPDLVDLVPLGSFDDETESYLWVNLEYETRLEVSILFMQRDLYAFTDPVTKDVFIDREIFMTEFSTVPEVVRVFDQYKDICKNFGLPDYPAPDSWTDWDNADDWVDSSGNIDWTTYPDWCQTCAEYTYEEPLSGPRPKCAYKIPIEVIPPQDLYFMSVVYFNGIYRTNPESIQDFGTFDMLTDIDFEQNKYSLMVDIAKFFTLEFQWFLKTTPGMIPFGCDYGTHIKHAIQTKNTEVRRINISNEINFFIFNFNTIYGSVVTVNEINITSKESESGGDTWIIEVDATVKEERLVYRVETTI